jgi:pimeloyl-ACP methyl ester carboxylesterase
LLLLNYFAANLDKWDPKVTNGFATDRDVILFDYPGIGGSSGETPSTVAALTNPCVEFCRALDLTRFDVLGFSLGGMIAQQGGGRQHGRRKQFNRSGRRHNPIRHSLRALSRSRIGLIVLVSRSDWLGLPMTEEAAERLDGQHSVRSLSRMKGRRCRHLGHTVIV